MKSQLSPHKVPAKSHGELHHYYYHRRHLSFSQRAASSLAAVAAARKRNHAAKIQMDNSPPPPPSTTTEKTRCCFTVLLLLNKYKTRRTHVRAAHKNAKRHYERGHLPLAHAQKSCCWFVASRSDRIRIRKLLVGNISVGNCRRLCGLRAIFSRLDQGQARGLRIAAGNYARLFVSARMQKFVSQLSLKQDCAL